ncbi:MAG: PqqD family protein [Acetobacteraceae bacterium]|nr:PqqD family protein [Acetobacteraceae bacterium]
MGEGGDTAARSAAEAAPADPAPGGTGAGSACPRRRDDVDSVAYEGKTALIDLVSGRVGLVNDVGLMVWEMCDGGTPPQAMLARLAQRFPRVPEDVLRRDLERFLEALKEGKFLVPDE